MSKEASNHVPQAPGSVIAADAASNYSGKVRRRVLLRRPISDPFYPAHACWWSHQDVGDQCGFADSDLSNVVVIFDAANGIPGAVNA